MENNINYYADKVHYNELTRESFWLIERTGKTYPTIGEFALVEWRVSFPDPDSYLGKRDENCIRTIREIGTPNENFPDPIPGMNYQGNAESANVDDDSIEGTTLSGKGFNKAKKKLDKVVTNKRRGRPAAEMNSLKARNVIRDVKQGKRKSDEEIVTEAFNYMTEAGEDAYLEKHFLPFI